MRLFFCIELTKDVRRALAERSAAMKRMLGSAKWVAAENLHITLRFLGELGEEKASQVRGAAAEVAQDIEPFGLQLTTLGAFPRPERARVLWVGPDAPVEEFEELASRLEQVAQAVGLPAERKEPSSHVTLARFRSPQNVAQVVAPIAEGPLYVPVNDIVLMQSVLGPQGPTYSPVERLALGG